MRKQTLILARNGIRNMRYDRYDRTWILSIYLFFLCRWGRLAGFEWRRARGGSDRRHLGMTAKIVIENRHFTIIGIGNGCNCLLF